MNETLAFTRENVLAMLDCLLGSSGIIFADRTSHRVYEPGSSSEPWCVTVEATKGEPRMTIAWGDAANHNVTEVLSAATDEIRPVADRIVESYWVQRGMPHGQALLLAKRAVALVRSTYGTGTILFTQKGKEALVSRAVLQTLEDSPHLPLERMTARDVLRIAKEAFWYGIPTEDGK